MLGHQDQAAPTTRLCRNLLLTVSLQFAVRPQTRGMPETLVSMAGTTPHQLSVLTMPRCRFSLPSVQRGLAPGWGLLLTLSSNKTGGQWVWESDATLGKQQELYQHPFPCGNAAGFQGQILPPPTPDVQKYLRLCSSAQPPLGK